MTSERTQNKYFLLIYSSRDWSLVVTQRKEMRGEFFHSSSFLSQGKYYCFLEKITQTQPICFAELREIKLDLGKLGIKATTFHLHSCRGLVGFENYTAKKDY